jgi:hypothetical protein
MNYSVHIVSAALVSLVAGCATVKVPQATGGSRSDGVVDLSYEYGMFEKPQVDWGQAASVARERCAAWGYTDAQPFGGAKSECQAFNGYGNCVRQLVTVSYQCTGIDAVQAHE